MTQNLIAAARKLFAHILPDTAMSEEKQHPLKIHLCALEACWKSQMSKFLETRDAEHLQAAGDTLYDTIAQTHGEDVAVVAFQASGWPRPWERSFSCPPAKGDKSRHDDMLHERLTDIGEAPGQWENLLSWQVQTLLDHILIRRNRRDSPFLEFGKEAGSGHWPHDDCDRG